MGTGVQQSGFCKVAAEKCEGFQPLRDLCDGGAHGVVLSLLTDGFDTDPQRRLRLSVGEVDAFLEPRETTSLRGTRAIVHSSFKSARLRGVALLCAVALGALETTLLAGG